MTVGLLLPPLLQQAWWPLAHLQYAVLCEVDGGLGRQGCVQVQSQLCGEGHSDGVKAVGYQEVQEALQLVAPDTVQALGLCLVAEP